MRSTPALVIKQHLAGLHAGFVIARHHVGLNHNDPDRHGTAPAELVPTDGSLDPRIGGR